MKNLLSIILISFLFFSCESLFFVNPQPAGVKNLEEFPVIFQDCWNDDSLSQFPAVCIADDSAVVFDMTYNEFSLDEISSDEDLWIEGNSIFQNKNDTIKAYPYELRNDSIFFEALEKMVFYLSDTLILRKIQQNNYVISIKELSNWELIFMSLEKDDGLIFYQLSSRKEIDKFIEFMDLQVDSISKNKHLSKDDISRKQMKKLVKSNILSDTLFHFPYRLPNVE